MVYLLQEKIATKQLKKPILMLLAGGYSKQSAEISGKSILNIWRKKRGLSSCSLI